MGDAGQGEGYIVELLHHSVTCHDELEEAQDDRHPGGVSVRGEASILEDLGGIVQHAGLSCDLLEQHQAASHQQRPNVALAEQGSQPTCSTMLSPL